MNYKTAAGSIQTSSTLNVMYDMATIIPACMYILMALVLLLVYGLNKKKTEELQVLKIKIIKKQVENNDVIIGAVDEK